MRQKVPCMRSTRYSSSEKVIDVKLAIIGYGNMGLIIERLAKSSGMEIGVIIDPVNPGATHVQMDEETLLDIDVCIDFTHPDVIMDNIEKYAKLGKNAVIGTTGWYDRMEDVKNLVENSGIGLIYSSNFSLGVYIFTRVVERAAELIDKFDIYDVAGIEYHHNRKADSPSGTAIVLANRIKDRIESKEKIVYDMLARRIGPNELHFASVRCGSIAGKHEIIFDSPADSITLTHSAKNREGFAAGALEAAKWIDGRKGFFDIDDLVREMMNIVNGEKLDK